MAGTVRIGATAGNAETTDRVAIRRDHGQKMVVMSLGGAKGRPRLPDLLPADELLVSAELELTTDCEQQQTDCTGKPYTFEPEVETQLLLARAPEIVTPEPGDAIPLAPPERVSITHARHHHVVVYDGVRHTVGEDEIAWVGPSFVNLALSAKSPKAQPGQVVIVGQNNPGGKPEGDMAGLSVARRRGRPTSTRLNEKALLASSIPVVKGETRVLYSAELSGLRAGTQLLVRAKVRTSTSHLSYPARTTLRLIVGDAPRDQAPGVMAKGVVLSPEVSRRNGTNRLPAERRGGSSMKVGVARVATDAPGPVYLNVVLETGDPHGLAEPGDEMRVLAGGGIWITRYEPEVDG